jgi:hypothetical protein
MTRRDRRRGAAMVVVERARKPPFAGAAITDESFHIAAVVTSPSPGREIDLEKTAEAGCAYQALPAAFRKAKALATRCREKALPRSWFPTIAPSPRLVASRQS